MSVKYTRSVPYKVDQGEPFKLSRSKIELFMQCPRCLWLDARLLIKRPSGPPFNLNKAVDELLKKEFDKYRKSSKPHPIMIENKIRAVPFDHQDLEDWRYNFVGVSYLDPKTNFHVYGAIDDVWINDNNELIVVDYKATSKTSEVNLDADWQVTYKRQVEIYQWLLKQNDFKVSNLAVFIYTNALVEPEEFNDVLEFKTKLIKYKGKTDWVEDTLIKIKETLNGPIPEVGRSAMGGICEFCEYAKKRTQMTLSLLPKKGQ